MGAGANVHRIVWWDAEGREGSLTLDREVTVIGRAPDCAIRTDDTKVSRHHARVVRRDEAFWLEDLDSVNGCFIDDERVTRRRLGPGDAVRCGRLLLRFVVDG